MILGDRKLANYLTKHVGTSQAPSTSDKSDICWGANCNERSDGELMVRLELIQFEVGQEQEMDLDEDGIPNTMDEEPETFNDYYDDDGCPDEVPSLIPDSRPSSSDSSNRRRTYFRCDECIAKLPLKHYSEDAVRIIGGSF